MDEVATAIRFPCLRARLPLRGHVYSLPPVLDPSDLREVAIGPVSPDLDLLLDAAVRRQSPELVERVLVAASD